MHCVPSFKFFLAHDCFKHYKKYKRERSIFLTREKTDNLLLVMWLLLYVLHNMHLLYANIQSIITSFHRIVCVALLMDALKRRTFSHRTILNIDIDIQPLNLDLLSDIDLLFQNPCIQKSIAMENYYNTCTHANENIFIHKKVIITKFLIWNTLQSWQKNIQCLSTNKDQCHPAILI